MIRINLLPEEYRKKARTPIKLVGALVGAVTVNTGLLAWWSFQWLGVQAEIESKAAALQTELDGLTPQVTYHKSLETEARHYEARESTLAGITSSRISWTRKLDELIDVVNRGQNGQRHLVWLDDLQVSQSSDPKSKVPGTVRANGHSGSDKFAQVANFLEDLEKSSFVTDFEPPAPPEGSQTNVDETLMPPVAWSFPLSLTLKSAEERVGTKKPAKEAPKKPDQSAKGDGAKQ
jgi:Tfp pilus assembly protein PilN